MSQERLRRVFKDDVCRRPRGWPRMKWIADIE